MINKVGRNGALKFVGRLAVFLNLGMIPLMGGS